MNTFSPDSYFDALESHFNQLAVAVAAGDIEVLPALSEQVQKLSINLAEVWQQWQRQGLNDAVVTARIKALAEGFQVVRANLLRRAMLVEQTLNLVVPATMDPTYAGGGAYGAGPKSSGRLSPMAV
ncbi:hypothetical protein [Rhodoferax sp.]|uniref:hypothetical protein n=1 Tax=Rhodoferax sp. TaxID=50421 RepID=UPI0025F6C0F8|nr:hypothetical protein [Rhodoferax sp.]